jgi:hypothetical protein
MPDPLAQMAQVSQIQSSQQQQQLNKMKIEELIADKQELNDFAAKIKDTGLTPRDYLKMLSASRNPERQKMGMEGLMRLDEQDKYGEVLKKIYPKLYEGSAETPAAAPAAMPGALRPTAAAPTNALAPAFGPTPGAPVNALVNQQNTPERLEMNIAALAPFASRPGVKEQIAGFQTQLAELRKPIVASAGSTIYGPSGQIIANVPAQPTELQRNYQAAKDQGYKGNIFDYERDIKFAGRAAATPAQPTPPVAVIDPATGQTIYVSREEALRNRMQPASAATSLKPLTEGQAIKLRTDVSKDYKAASTALTQMDDLLDSIDKVRTAPGLTAATGFTVKYLPSFPEGKAAQAETRLANLRGKVTALGKATAAMSGAIGSIANQEWKILSDQIAVLDEVKGKGPLLEQINLVEQQARGAIDRIRDTYEKTRAEDFERFPQFRDLPAPRGKKDSGGGGIDALLDKYK